MPSDAAQTGGGAQCLPGSVRRARRSLEEQQHNLRLSAYR
jgi:hypothetical protein